jgi:hypothetical protein
MSIVTPGVSPLPAYFFAFFFGAAFFVSFFGAAFVLAAFFTPQTIKTPPFYIQIA